MSLLRSQKVADQWFAEYAECHQDETNKTLHWLCIPLIVLGLAGLLWDLPVPSIASERFAWFHWTWVAIGLAMVFYLRLSLPLAAGMALVVAVAVGVIVLYERLEVGPVWVASLVVFVAAWIGQFVGHKMEGKKPAFLDDLKFLLIGPLWLLGFVYRRLGIRY